LARFWATIASVVMRDICDSTVMSTAPGTSGGLKPPPSGGH
jgi:hypothetical protein